MISMCGLIFDRGPHPTPLCAEPNGFSSCFRLVAEAILEIGTHRQIRCGHDVGYVSNHPVAAHRVVSLAYGKGVPRACCSQRLEAKSSKQSCSSDVPRIGNNKRRVSIVKRSKDDALLFLSSHSSCSFLHLLHSPIYLCCQSSSMTRHLTEADWRETRKEGPMRHQQFGIKKYRAHFACSLIIAGAVFLTLK